MAAGYNINACTWLVASGPSQIERVVLEWFRGWIGYPQRAGGQFTSGGSAASLNALVAAREAAGSPDRAAALNPIAVCANAGAGGTGAIDPLEEAAAFCAAEGLWLHVDAAYGGFAVVTEEGKRLLRGMEQPTRSASTRTSGSSSPTRRAAC